METLLIAQMGTTEQKNQLASKITGVPYECIQQFFSASAMELPCIYLIHLNDVKTLRTHMNIPQSYTDNMIVFKYGQTKDFEDRKNGHRQMFKSIKDHIEMKLVHFSYIDPKYVSKAETELKQLVKPHIFVWNAPDKNYDEILILTKKELGDIKKHYKKVGTEFSGHNDQINKVLQEKTHQLEVSEAKAEVQEERIVDLKGRLEDKEQTISNLEGRLQDKDDIIAMLKRLCKYEEI